MSVGEQAPSARPALSDKWQMLITTGGAWPARVQHIPVPEFFEVCPDGKHFRLETKMGPLFTSFYGDLEWLDTDYLHYHVRAPGPGPGPCATRMVHRAASGPYASDGAHPGRAG